MVNTFDYDDVSLFRGKKSSGQKMVENKTTAIILYLFCSTSRDR